MPVSQSKMRASVSDFGTVDHLGIVASDSQSAMQNMSELLGLPWRNQLVDSARTYELNGEIVEVTMNVGWIDAPTPLEFISAVPDFIWEPRREPYIHHLAFTVDNFDGVCAMLRARGWPHLLTVPNEMKRPLRFALFRIEGLLIELLDKRFAPLETDS
jgi:Glyoxalase/Bleomycin resistance protein/Dioxygenase superfamily